MISKSEIKLIRALKSKKQRDKLNLFVAEGAKLVESFASSGLVVKKLYNLTTYSGTLSEQSEAVSESEMSAISSLETNSPLLGVFQKPNFHSEFSSPLLLALDDVRDPGNMGTIIRLADWFGVKTLFCSPTCVDVFNSKVVQSTMGSLANVNIVSQALSEVFEIAKQNGFWITGAEMDGTKLAEFKTDKKLLLVMGNEANGISAENQKFLDESITIEKATSSQAESLNVAMATAILLGSLRSVN
jgi:TrmH family RNA methyltransferase